MRFSPNFGFRLFHLPSSRDSRFLRAIVRTGLQFVLFADVAVEVNDFLFGFADFGHGVSPIHIERDEPLKFGIVFLPVFVGVSLASNANARALNKGIKVISCARSRSVSLRCHWEKERDCDFAFWRDRYLTNLLKSVESANRKSSAT